MEEGTSLFSFTPVEAEEVEVVAAEGGHQKLNYLN